jgi:hypothetical protein
MGKWRLGRWLAVVSLAFALPGWVALVIRWRTHSPGAFQLQTTTELLAAVAIITGLSADRRRARWEWLGLVLGALCFLIEAVTMVCGRT